MVSPWPEVAGGARTGQIVSMADLEVEGDRRPLGRRVLKTTRPVRVERSRIRLFERNADGSMPGGGAAAEPRRDSCSWGPATPRWTRRTSARLMPGA
jgi:hypothetical protein